ncbi:hypothetical protein DFA_04421 [Cavenderia fasciculata]|uniref:Ankyrin repeat-containing protein n=1 Tax=Cavenderia fasciculata TaxID=261658 RepID=F4PPJ0_CACFS|nr:uncharacterized protein DFA_04421 [Cavenderia fasciculata]EGG22303.1 hypothetical protein DFA_04421 [Cavenderia fasciculata]|eukprot:XP_004360154.1 hypothetical protein DFA_04421 [Cavenderia fasciculata]
MTATTTSFHCIFRSIYIRQLIFNQINDISNQLYSKEKGRYDGRQRSLKGRDIIKLPRLEMISIYAMPWHFICHYLPKDCNQILPKRRRIRVISEYCCHHNATSDTLRRLVDWSYFISFCIDWLYLKRNLMNIHSQEVLEYLISIHSSNDTTFVTEAAGVACTYGHLSTVKLIYSIKGIQFNCLAIDYACRNGFIDIVKYLHDNRAEGCTTNLMDTAARGGYFDIVKFLHFNRTEGCTTKALDNAAMNGHLEMVRFLHEHRTEGCTEAAMDNASLNGHIDVVKFLGQHRTEGCSNALDRASRNGHIDVVKYLNEHHSDACVSTDAMDWAAENGHLEVVKYLHEHRNGQGATTDAIDNASKNGHVEIVKYLFENRTERCTSNAMHLAAEKGHIEIIRYLYQCYNIDEITAGWSMTMAARNGHIEIVKSFYEGGVQIFGDPKLALEDAVRQGNIEMVSYLVHTCNIKCLTGTLITAIQAASETETCKLGLDVFHFLFDNFKEQSKIWTPEVMDRAAEFGQIDIVKLLHFNRTEGATTDAMDLAAKNGHIEIVKFLHFNRSEGCTKKAVISACLEVHLEVATFLINVAQVEWTKKDPLIKILKRISDPCPTNYHYDIVQLLISQPFDEGDTEMIQKRIQRIKKSRVKLKNDSYAYETRHLLKIHMRHLESIGNEYSDDI